MSSLSLPIGRVSMQMQGISLVSNLQSDEASLQNLSQQLSSGQSLSQPSDNPTAAVGIIRLNQQISANTQYSNNLNFANGSLSTADSTLMSLSNMVSSAQSVASSMIGTGVTATERQAQASVIDSYISQALEYANTQYQGQSIFGGQNTTQNAYSSVDGGYLYQGTNQGESILSPTGSSLPYTLDGSTVFGGVASQVGGGQSLSVALTGNTKLSDLAGALSTGVSLGTVNVTAGATTVSVDLSNAATVSDVVNKLNAGLASAGSNATVGFSGGAFTVTGDTTQSVTIADTANGNTAADLGLATTVAANGTYTGANVGAEVTATTPLSALNDGAGLDPSGFIITNGSSSATITLAGLTTVQDLLNKINGSNTNVTATINSSGNGISVANSLSGSALTIGENGGLTATQLGIRSMNAQTPLADLNQGIGLGLASATNTGPTGTIVINKTDGTSFNVSVNGITTPSQLAAAINAAGGGVVTAALNSNGLGISLTDTSGGGGNLSVTPGSDYQSNGTVLGILTTGSAGGLTGANMTFPTDDMQITQRDGASFTVDVTGATTIQDVLDKINNADGNVGPNKVTASLNTTGNGIELTDASTGSGTLTVTALNGSSAAQQLGILQTASSPGNVINGNDVNPVEPQGLFSSLIMLRTALLNNDTAGITQAGQLLQQDSTRVITANGLVGAREQDIAQRQTSITSEQTQMQSSLSLLQDTNMTTVITQYQQLLTSYQAALQVGAQTSNLSLLEFL